MEYSAKRRVQIIPCVMIVVFGGVTANAAEPSPTQQRIIEQLLLTQPPQR